MVIHGNAKLGLGGRLALVARHRGAAARAGKRRDATASRRRPHASGGDAGRRRATRSERRSPACTTALRVRTAARACSAPRAAPHLRGPAPLGLGAAADRGRDRPPARDRLADAQASGHLAAAAPAAGAGLPLRVALPRRPAADRLASASRASRGQGTPSPADRSRRAPRCGRGWATSSCTRPSTTTHGSPTRSSTADERAATVVGFLERALAFYAAHGIELKRLALRQRLVLHEEQRAGRAARPAAASAACGSGRGDRRRTARSSATSRR